MRKFLSPEILIGLVIGLIIATLFMTGFFEKYEENIIDSRFAWRGNVDSDAPIVYVGVTDNCLKEFGWPIDRGVYGDVIENLFKWKAKSVCLDIFIDEPGEEEGATRLVQAVKNNSPVVLPVVLVGGSALLSLPSIDDRTLDTETDYLVPSETFDELKEASDYRGYTSIGWKNEINHDGVVRKVPLSRKIIKQEMYAFSFLGAATYLETVKRTGEGKISLETESIPLWTDFNGQEVLLVNYLKVETKYEILAFPLHSLSGLARRNRQSRPDIAGKLVIIGPVYGMADYYAGPVKPVRGMEIHALIAASIITGDYIRRLPVKASSLLIITFALLTAWLLKRFSVWISFGLVLGILGGLVVSTYALFSYGGLIIEFIPLLVTLILVTLVVECFKFVTERKHHLTIKNAFKCYLHPELVNEVVNNPGILKLGGEKKILTVFFSDITNFTSISERLPVEQMVLQLNEYLTEMSTIIMDNYGTVDKFEGDAVMAFYGAPLPQEDHALKACRASLLMQTRLHMLRKKWNRENKPEFHVRMGINTGPMIVGNMGSKSKMDYTVMGDSVNLASRLEGVNKEYKTEIIVSEYTYDEVKNFFVMRELDIIKVVGKENPVKIYELIGRVGKSSEESREKCRLFEKALLLYKKREWKKAFESFTAIDRSFPNDGPTRTYLTRCRQFMEEPPLKQWDGTFAMRNK